MNFRGSHKHSGFPSLGTSKFDAIFFRSARGANRDACRGQDRDTQFLENRVEFAIFTRSLEATTRQKTKPQYFVFIWSWLIFRLTDSCLGRSARPSERIRAQRGFLGGRNVGERSERMRAERTPTRERSDRGAWAGC
jgi:hypothetical protein